MSIKDDLVGLIRPAVESLGYEFVGLEYLSNPKNRLVRVYIDRDPEGIGVEDCAEVSHEVSALLDVEDPIAGDYSLEVSSPGIERPLFEPEHFRRFCGEVAQVHLFWPVANRRKIKGVIRDADAERVVLETDGQLYELAYEVIRRANLKPDLDALLSGR